MGDLGAEDSLIGDLGAEERANEMGWDCMKKLVVLFLAEDCTAVDAN